jgi:hypothetical protein
MGFYDDPMNRSVPTEANRGLTSYTSEHAQIAHRPHGLLYLDAMATAARDEKRIAQHLGADSPYGHEDCSN